MRGLIRSLVAISAIAAGSWVSLHREVPTPAPAQQAPASSSSSPSPSPSSSSSAAEEAPTTTTAAAPTETASTVTWPHLNPEANIMKAWRLAEGPHRAPGDKKKLVTLTFDDGPFPETTPKVLDLLGKHNVHATFFVIGRYLDGESERARASRDVLKKVDQAGHLIGNHTHDHQLLSAVSHAQAIEQIDRGSQSIENAIGKKPILFRPPFGELDDFGQEAVRARGLDIILWSLEAKDMERDDTQGMYRDIVRYLNYNEGGVVLLHDIRPSSVVLLKKLLDYLELHKYDPNRPEREGYAIVDMPTYLRALEASPPQPGVRSAAAPPTPPAQAAKTNDSSKKKKAKRPMLSTPASSSVSISHTTKRVSR